MKKVCSQSCSAHRNRPSRIQPSSLSPPYQKLHNCPINYQLSNIISKTKSSTKKVYSTKLLSSSKYTFYEFMVYPSFLRHQKLEFCTTQANYPNYLKTKSLTKKISSAKLLSSSKQTIQDLSQLSKSSLSKFT